MLVLTETQNGEIDVKMFSVTFSDVLESATVS